MDDRRGFRSQHSPRDDNGGPMSSFVSPPRNGGPSSSRMGLQQQQQSPAAVGHDPRSTMPRRFTTDSGYVPTLSTMASMQRGQPDSSQDYKTMQQVQLIEKKKQEYERIREQRMRFERQMMQLEAAQRREAAELAKMEEEMGRIGGHQSEPTTPPEYHDSSGFPSLFSRPNRYSTSSLTSPPGFYNRAARSGSQLASPPAGVMMNSNGFGFDSQSQQHMPSRSVPGTRRNSDDEKDEAVRQDPTSHRSGNALNRYSMPVTRSRNDYSSLDHANTTGFLFGDDENSAFGPGQNRNEDFPTLVRRNDQMLSASSAALDLALSGSPAPESSLRGWNNVNRHRAQQSLSSLNGTSTSLAGDIGSIGSRTGSLRNSVDLKYLAENAVESGLMSPQSANHMTTPPKLQSSFSANDVPTVKSTQSSMANTHAQQHFHNHNASMGRIPAGAVPTRGHNRELSSDSTTTASREQQSSNFQSFQSALHANAPVFSSSTATAGLTSPQITSPVGAPLMNNFNGGYYPQNGFNPAGLGQNTYGNMNMLAAGLQHMNMNGMGANPQNMYQGTPNFGGYNGVPYNQPAPQAQPQRDSQTRVMQNRRQQDNEAMSRYQNMPLESFRNQIYQLCKDQHGCRYLQKKLEERDPTQVHMIWLETNEHVTELMMDPFGNYLCQKLLEFCNDDERTRLIENASRDMSRIALDQHGTRALQKMIEHVSTPQQIHLITEALRNRVVELIQDLNGNHVIQKCLNKLSPAEAQFIFDAVGQRCVEVGTHRHGCCVLQRCIDHADGNQKVWLIGRITENARRLVQDPFGNYVVQYIIDLNEPKFTEPVVAAFASCICDFSSHKFSSNVIEKCLRCAKGPSKDMIVQELLTPGRMEGLLKDAYANYVIQTALDFATPQGKHMLIEAVRPFLPQIRGTPHGRRIQTKITAFDNAGGTVSSGQATPADQTQGQIPLRQQHSRTTSATGSAVAQPNGLATATTSPMASAPQNGYQNAGPLPVQPQGSVTQLNGHVQPSQPQMGQMNPAQQFVPAAMGQQALGQQAQFGQQQFDHQSQANFGPVPNGQPGNAEQHWV
ncbi:pumilio-family RNA binding repeat domain-containing protein [Sarocladium implicatum]|nr:pumilio-family RNA binding repeat domain-containing protein [Sarocladium implicatum]